MYKEKMMTKVNDDQLARDSIVNELDKNFFVEASAGSGKTTSLVYRMVALIERKNVPVDKICTITFTKAAADEFFSRFQKLLSIRSVPIIDEDSEKVLGPKNEETMKRCQEALNNIDLCFLGTIDAFCNMIAHELPSELNLPSDSMVISKEENSRIIKEEYYKILQEDSHDLHQLAIKIKDLFWPDFDSFNAVLSAVSEIRNAEIIYDNKYLDIDIEEYLKDEKKQLLEACQILCSHDVIYDNGSGGKRNEKYKHQTALKVLYRKVSHSNWNDCLSDVGKAIKVIKRMDGFSLKSEGTSLDDIACRKSSKDRSIKYTDEFIAWLNNITNKIDEYKYCLMMTFVLSAMKDINEKLKAQGKFKFFDYLYYLTNAFKKSAATDRVVVDHIFNRHSYFLLDESQDTNPLQTEMFFYLTGTKTALDVEGWDWSKTEPKEGSLFIVGDPKQSIYSFRNANVQAYKKTRAIFEAKDEVLVLTRNFRSNVALKTWFNASMNNILNHGDDPLEHKDIPIGDNEPTREITNPKVLDGAYKYVTSSKDDPDSIAKFISEYVDNDEYLISDKKGNVRKIKYCDFLIVPYKTDVNDIIKTFNDYNIPMTIEASIPFGDSEILCALKDLLYLLKEPSNKDYFLKVMFGKLFKLNESDIIQMMNNHFRLDISNLYYKNGNSIVFSNQKHSDILTLLNKLYEKTIGLSYSSTLTYLLNNSELNIFKVLDSRFIEYTYFLIEKIKEKEESGEVSSLGQLREFIESFVSANTDDNRTLRFKDKIDRVKVSNLHKVKGLQAPIVILAKPKVGVRKVTRYVDCNSNPPKAYFSAIMGGEYGNSAIISTHLFDDQLDKWNAFARAEKDRLEYVAATRAESLLLVATPSDTFTDSYSNPWTGIANNITETINVPTNVTPKEIKVIEASMIEPTIKEELYDATYHHVLPSDIRYDSGNNNKDEIDDYLRKEDATTIGTIIHKFMECIISSHNSYKDIDQLINKIANEYWPHPLYPNKYVGLLKRVSNTLFNGGFIQKNSNQNADILNTLLNAEKVWCEVPFTYKEDNNIINGVIDCMYLDDRGYHIIDYKTNKEDDVSVLEKEYESQLNHYINAVKVFGITADAHIYHIKV